MTFNEIKNKWNSEQILIQVILFLFDFIFIIFKFWLSLRKEIIYLLMLFFTKNVRYKGNFFTFAESFLAAIETASIAFAPKFIFWRVPSKLINIESAARGPHL